MKIVVLEPLGISKEMLEEKIRGAVGPQVAVTLYDDRKEDVASLIERSRDADIVVLSNIKYPKEVMEACPDLKYINVAFTGYDHVDMAYAKERGIQVSNCQGYSTVAVADLVFGMVISHYRNVCELNEAVRQGGTKGSYIGPELAGKTFGVVGLGAIGERVAKIAQAFDCEVLGYNRSPKKLAGVKQVSLEELLKRSDIVSLHVPQTDDTKGMINKDSLALMKKDALLVNLARGPVVDSQALAAALNEDRIGGAIIDVYETEPPIAQDHPLLTAKNVLATPHIAFSSQQAMVKRADIVAENLKAYLAGDPINLV